MTIVLVHGPMSDSDGERLWVAIMDRPVRVSVSQSVSQWVSESVHVNQWVSYM
jgi:hypothetical protein